MDLISITGNHRLQIRSDARFLCDELFVCVAVLVFLVLPIFMHLCQFLSYFIHIFFLLFAFRHTILSK